ncbi:MAG: hypothetical protein KJ879_00910 [Nanoarchaeota archaeon]|nr:hypothetical protein [Nanoarchaeota archaeon]
MNIKKIVKDWLGFWNSLNYGPKGAFAGFVIALGYFLVPWILKLLLVILIIAAVTLIGAGIGEIVGWLIKLLKKRK